MADDNDEIDIKATPRLLVRRLIANGELHRMAVVDTTSGRAEVSPFAGETANTVFFDGTLELLTEPEKPPRLLRRQTIVSDVKTKNG